MATPAAESEQRRAARRGGAAPVETARQRRLGLCAVLLRAIRGGAAASVSAVTQGARLGRTPVLASLLVDTFSRCARLSAGRRPGYATEQDLVAPQT